jgi:hypothetical protein
VSKRERERERGVLSEYHHVTIMKHCPACKGGSFRFNTGMVKWSNFAKEGGEKGPGRKEGIEGRGA